MNKKFTFLVAAASLAFLGAGCMNAQPAPAPAPAPNVVEPPPVSTPSATGPDSVSTGALHVTWSAPKQVDPPDVFVEGYKTFEDYIANGPNSSTTTVEYLNAQNYRQVGLVKDGAYAGGKVVFVHASIQCGGMGGGETYYHFVVPVTGRPVMLSKLSAGYLNGDETPNCQTFDYSKFVMDETAEAPELTLPEKLQHAGSDFKLSLSDFYGDDKQVGTPMFDPKGKTLAFTDPGVGKVYTDDADSPSGLNGFYAVAPDGTVRTYALIVPFYDENLHVPAITWSDGATNTDEYWLAANGGCGPVDYANVIFGVSKTELKAAGLTSQGEKVYLLKDANHELLKSLYDIYAPASGSSNSELQRMPYGEFVKDKPIFFWYDPFGRLIGFHNTAFMAPSECGKPVIYLYPPKTTDVSVKLTPQGGFTKSEPAYDGGWNVRATPNGELTDLKDGKSYPYLFWEGNGGLYQTPTQGFNVAKDHVHAFLAEKLSKLGLNAKESADFMEFWEPRMTDAPYYFVTFLGNRAMDALAPMTVAPKPNHVIRILMDFHPLAAPISVQGFDIHPPKRDGFTVVEWGGVLR